MSGREEYKYEDGVDTDDRVQGADTVDDSYATPDGPVPVQKDDDRIEEARDEIDPDSDEALNRDDEDAIDKSNIIEEKTRHAAPKGGYREPGDDEGLPSEDGTSQGRAN